MDVELQLTGGLCHRLPTSRTSCTYCARSMCRIRRRRSTNRTHVDSQRSGRG